MPADVERLFRIIAPALVLLAGCDAKEGGSKADVEAKAPVDVSVGSGKRAVDGEESPEPSIEEAPADVGGGTAPTREQPSEVATPGPEPVKPLKPLKPGPATLAEAPRPSGATCPSGLWCTDIAGAKEGVTGGTKYSQGCPVDVGFAVGVGAPQPGSLKPLSEEATKAKRAEGTKDACCYSWYEQCPGGRPLLDDVGTPVVASFETGFARAWGSDREGLPASPAARAFAAQAWLEDAAMEHASVASFGRVALELLSLGAPPELVEGAHLAALDEIRHAKTCLSLARACGAEEVEPGRLAAVPQRRADFARFAADTFIEGCVGESIAALVVTRAAAGAEDAVLRAALEEIAADEARHAALAWKMVSWAIEQGGAPVLAAIHDAADRLRPATSEGSSAGREPDGIGRLGRLGALELARARRDGWMGIVDPMLMALQTPPIAA